MLLDFGRGQWRVTQVALGLALHRNGGLGNRFTILPARSLGSGWASGSLIGQFAFGKKSFRICIRQ